MARRKAIMVLFNLIPILILFFHTLALESNNAGDTSVLDVVHEMSRRHVQEWPAVLGDNYQQRHTIVLGAIGLLLKPFARLGIPFDWIQYPHRARTFIRLAFALVHGISVAHLSRTIRQRYGARHRIWYLILSLSRRMPISGDANIDTLSTATVSLCISLILKCSPGIPAGVNTARTKKAIITLSAASILLDIHLVAILIPTVVSLVYARRVTLKQGLRSMVVGLLAALALHIVLQDRLIPPHHVNRTLHDRVMMPIRQIISDIPYQVAEDKNVSARSIYDVGLASVLLTTTGFFWTIINPKSKTLSGITEVMSLFGLTIPTIILFLGFGINDMKLYLEPILDVVAALTASALCIHKPRGLDTLVGGAVVFLIAWNVLSTSQQG